MYFQAEFGNSFTIFICTLDVEEFASGYASLLQWEFFNHHMPVFEQNRVYYRSLQDANPRFSTQVLFVIDWALQIYWHSCGEHEDHRAIHMKTLQMQDLQNNIEHHNFSYILPRILSKKFNSDQSNQQKTPPKKTRKESSSSKASVLNPVIMPTNSLPKKKLNLMTSYQSVGLGFSARGRGKSQSLNCSPLPPPSSNITHHS